MSKVYSSNEELTAKIAAGIAIAWGVWTIWKSE